MSIIKEIRTELNCTQIELAEKTGLSLRTIQRLETGDNEPKGHTLKVLSEAFNMEPSTFRKRFSSGNEEGESDKLSINFINLSVLAFFVCPLGNIIVPIFLWNKKRSSKLVDEVGRKIINLQIIWTLVLFSSLCISPFIPTSFPLILIVLFVLLGINIIIVFTTAYWIKRDRFDILNLPISLF